MEAKITYKLFRQYFPTREMWTLYKDVSGETVKTYEGPQAKRQCSILRKSGIKIEITTKGRS